MDKKSKSPKNKWINLLIVAGFLLVAAGLIFLSRSLSSPNAGLTQEEIQKKQEELATAAPAPTAGPTDAPEASTEQESLPPALPESTAAPAGYVFIIIDNRVYGIEALGEERDVTVDQGDGVVNVVHIMPDGYYMLSSTCDNQLCVSEGTVTVTNYQQRILGPCVYCLPHNLMLELVVPGATADPNAPDV